MISLINSGLLVEYHHQHPPLQEVVEETTRASKVRVLDVKSDTIREFQQEGKIFVGNLPTWIKKNEVADFFRQFGPIKDVILIKGHEYPERNVGYGFIIYGGATAANSAMKSVEFDGVEFHGRVLTVKLDDGRRLKTRSDDRDRWLAGSDEVEYRSNWHEERESSRNDFRKVLETQLENWQTVVLSFKRIKKPSRREFGLMVNYYARRGDAHHAREVFERMRARGIEPTSHVYTSLIHAYAVARDMEEALSCVRKMKAEGIEMNIVTYSVVISGFAKIVNAKAADKWFKEAKGTHEIEGYYLWQYNICSLECGFTPSVISHGCLINLLTKMGKVTRALEVSKKMESNGIKHNMKTYSMLINGFLKLSDWANAFAIFEGVVKAGLKLDAVLYG